ETREKQADPREAEEALRALQRYFESPEGQLAMARQRIQELERENARLQLEVDLFRARHPLAKLTKGMPQARVEQLVGKPDRVEDGSWKKDTVEVVRTRTATYAMRLPDRKGDQMITVHYQQGKKGWAFTEWRGPHFPD